MVDKLGKRKNKNAESPKTVKDRFQTPVCGKKLQAVTDVDTFNVRKYVYFCRVVKRL